MPKNLKRESMLAPLDANQRYTIDESARYLRTSRVSVYRKIADGSLRVIKERKRSYIGGVDLIAASRPR